MLNDKQRETVRDYFNGDKIRLMIQNAEEEIKKEYRAFVEKEGAK